MQETNPAERLQQILEDLKPSQNFLIRQVLAGAFGADPDDAGRLALIVAELLQLPGRVIEAIEATPFDTSGWMGHLNDVDAAMPIGCPYGMPSRSPPARLPC